MREVYIGIDAHKATNLLAFAPEDHDAPDLIGRVSTLQPARWGCYPRIHEEAGPVEGASAYVPYKAR